ncbi:RNA-binding protein [Pseudalkalibacillus caeni]|uniref:RNA-binding protein n=1 Tax=Exobacillus caeni TaxID=2574798 RepID=A0A5R9EXI8_9BACL|nr:RNA-binding protein [Pseudalkalibacillus caeni]TLS35259.1 RNA-binding protein [Pseudalkalibacillus caeni]
MSIYEHFRKEERSFVDKVLEWQLDVKNRYAPKLTDFLDPRERLILSQVIGNDPEVQLEFRGGTDGAERMRALLAPPYFEIKEEDFELALLSVNYPSKFVTLTHRNVLGSLMSIGLKRAKFGDIVLAKEEVQMVVAREIVDYVRLNLTSIGKATVSLDEIPFSKAIKAEKDWTEETGTVSSMRLDTVLAEIYNLSRSKASTYIQGEMAKVNWKIASQPSFEIEEQDILSLRGYGRSKIISIEGKTKKEKWRIIFGRQK